MLPPVACSSVPHHRPVAYYGRHASAVPLFSANRSSKQQALFRKYSIRPDKVPVISSSGAKLAAPKPLVIQKALESYQLALKNKIVGNHTQDYRATSLMLNNGLWQSGTNVELDRECTFCGERSALVAAKTEALEKLSLNRLQKMNEAQLQQVRDGMKARMLVMATSDLEDYAEVCADCESWMTSPEYFTPQTQFVSLRKDGEGRFTLSLQQLKERLPEWRRCYESVQVNQGLSIEALPVQVSRQAQQVMVQKGLHAVTLAKMMTYAKTESGKNSTAEFSGNPLGAAVLFTTGKIQTAGRFEWKRRWSESPDLMAAATGIQENRNKQNRVEAVAYYGVIPAFQLVNNLGRLAQERWGGPDTLVVTMENDTLKVQTIADRMPKAYVSKTYLGLKKP